MPGDGAGVWAADPLRAGLPRPAECPHGVRRLLGGLVGVVAYAGPVAFGVAAHLAAFHLDGVMRWLKTSDSPEAETDWC